MLPTDRYFIRTAINFMLSATPEDVWVSDLDNSLPHEIDAISRTFSLAFGTAYCSTSELTEYIKPYVG